MARTTLDLDSSVLKELRRRGRADHKSMGRVASELLAAALAREADQPAPAAAFRWRSADLGEPRLNLEDKDALSALLDLDRDHRP